MNNGLSLLVVVAALTCATTIHPACASATPTHRTSPAVSTNFPSRFSVRTTGGLCLTRNQFGLPSDDRNDVITRQCGEWGQNWKLYPVGAPWSDLYRISDDSEFSCLEAENRFGRDVTTTRFVFRMCDPLNPYQLVTFIPRGGRVLLTINPARCAAVVGEPHEVSREVGEQWCDVYDPRQLFSIMELPEDPAQYPVPSQRPLPAKVPVYAPQ